MKKKVSIVGFGRFGQTLYRLLKDDFQITLYNRHPQVFEKIKVDGKTVIAEKIADIYRSEVIFYCVPIAVFKSVINSHRRYFKKHLLVDVLSVKEHPAKIFRKYLKGTEAQAILTHPMFGPDSSQSGFSNLPLVMDKFLSDGNNYAFWKKYFSDKGLSIIEISPEEHDRLAANSQGLTHFIGRLLAEFGFKPTEIDTYGTKKLHEVESQTCNDTWQLFTNLQNYNRYTGPMRVRLGKAYDKLYDRLIPKKANPKKVIYGIQGGLGSFNEEAVLFYTGKKNIKKFKIKYLYTTEKVLKSLHEGSIDYGLFAIQNAVGGVVEESAYAMARYRFKIIDEFAIPIRHYLMKKIGVGLSEIDAIMAHPQVFRQCRHNLSIRYSKKNLVSGKGDLIDTAKAAWALSKNKIPSTTAILGPKRLAEIYGLEIIDQDLQDDKTNNTTFFLAGRD
ncbi:prephenate dehydrogenase/arogenate dehydrogenase family protein [Candidatus Roizmanbacteria bacterium]|nr:prephenate dehydrogenase/arogenate dehydrogenase family protein [Candidatus Roizmanbacteria bacterium]